MTKVTIADKFDALADYIQNGENSIFPTPEDAIEFIEDRKAKAMKKAGNRKPTAQQKENEGFKESILDVLTSEGKTVSEIIAMSDDLSGLTNQRVSALLRQLVLAGKVVKTKEGKKSLFIIAE